MPKTKLKSKKTTVKPNKSAKRILTGKKPALHAKKKKKEMSADIIYDSKVGRTDALFVSDPEPENDNPKPEINLNTQVSDPEISAALKELDAMDPNPPVQHQPMQEDLPAPFDSPSTSLRAGAQGRPEEKLALPAEQKKTFLQKLLFWKK